MADAYAGSLCYFQNSGDTYRGAGNKLCLIFSDKSFICTAFGHAVLQIKEQGGKNQLCSFSGTGWNGIRPGYKTAHTQI